MDAQARPAQAHRRLAYVPGEANLWPGPVPATGVHWTAAAWLTGLAVICALAGLVAFSRRDLVAA